MDILKSVKEENGIKPIYGNTYTPHDANILNATIAKYGEGYMGDIKFNPDGTVAETPKEYLIANPEMIFMNRYRQVDEHTIDVCIDREAIKRMGTGAYLSNEVTVYTIYRKDKREKLKVKEIRNIRTEDFEREFKGSFKQEVMANSILPLITTTNQSPTLDDLMI